MAEQKQFVGKVEYAKGLEGVISNESTIGYVDGAKGWLIYRGINIMDLAEYSNYEETAYLLLFAKLPTKQELVDFKKKLVEYREVPKGVIEVLRQLPNETHPMAALRTGISALGTFDTKAEQVTVENCTEIGVKLVAQMATVAGAVARLRKGQEPVAPDPSLDHATNFLYMCNGEKPDDLSAKLMDVSLILHADHGNNASTFTCLLVISSLADIYSSVTAGIGSLKGPLHGGANEVALQDIMSIGSVDKVDDWVKDAIAKKKKFMGFGHRVYKAYDPRARVLGKYSMEITEKKGIKHLYDIAARVEEKVIEAYGERGIFPNVDFYSGTIYHALGIETEMFTPIFAVSRVVGWVARAIEYLADNRIFRPRAVYVGVMEAPYLPIDKR
ncbi:MAG: citrate synthase/methylcitrate synthase [Thermodesulfobacteriota bacterium]